MAADGLLLMPPLVLREVALPSPEGDLLLVGRNKTSHGARYSLATKGAAKSCCRSYSRLAIICNYFFFLSTFFK